MPNPLVECIPNFSEARRSDVVEKIIQSIQSVPGVTILDRHSDLDHNRTVVTFVGSPTSVEEAAFQGVKCAAGLINLDEHQGAHPRIGAADVVPFVPISDITMQECIEMARRLGKRVGTELNIPVYLYEDAAARPERQNLEHIRRGQYEALKEEMGKLPEREPDYGPVQLGTAGATVIGARQPLIAFNVYLSTSDVEIAQKIAKSVRASNGGFRFIKAMGVLVEGLAQVSMNMTNFRQSTIARVVEFVRREAARYGVMIHHSELVGLTPQQALIDAAQWYLQLDQFHPDQILERKLFETVSPQSEPETGQSSFQFLEDLAAPSPTPGGGCAAAFSAAMAAGLTTMVARLTVGKKKYADVEQDMWKVIEHSELLRKEFTVSIESDAKAFDLFMAATKLPKETEDQTRSREEAIQNATLGAIEVPLGVTAKLVELIPLAREVAEKGNINAISDAGSAGSLALAALNAAGLNIQINCQGLKDQSLAEKNIKEFKKLNEIFATHYKNLQSILDKRAGIILS